MIFNWLKQIRKEINWKLKTRKWKKVKLPIVNQPFVKWFIKTYPMSRACDFDLECQFKENSSHDEKWKKLKLISEKGVCSCNCHVDGQDVVHCFSCCALCYEKYITVDYQLDVERYKGLCKKRKLKPFKT